MAWQRNIPFGYRMESGEIVINQPEADTVVFIYDSYLRGDSYLSIAKAMSRLDIRYHEAVAEWNKHMVKRMLENPKYTGQEEYPAIVPADIWSNVQAARDRKTAGQRSQPVCVEMVKRRLVCGECGSPFSKDTSKNASGYRWWHCSNPECSYTFKIPIAKCQNGLPPSLQSRQGSLPCHTGLPKRCRRTAGDRAGAGGYR